MNGILRMFLSIFLFIFLLSIAVLSLSLIPQGIEKLTLGESSYDFCEKQGGEFYDEVFSLPVCFIDGVEHKIYSEDKQWRLSK